MIIIISFLSSNIYAGHFLYLLYIMWCSHRRFSVSPWFKKVFMFEHSQFLNSLVKFKWIFLNCLRNTKKFSSQLFLGKVLKRREKSIKNRFSNIYIYFNFFTLCNQVTTLMIVGSARYERLCLVLIKRSLLMSHWYCFYFLNRFNFVYWRARAKKYL